MDDVRCVLVRIAVTRMLGNALDYAFCSQVLDVVIAPECATDGFIQLALIEL